MEWNFADAWEAIADVIPQSLALVDGRRRIDWRGFDRSADALAEYFVACGGKPGDKVALYLRNCSEYLVAVFAAFKVRLVPVNVNYRYREEELAYLLENSDASFLLFHGSCAEELDKALRRLGSRQAFKAIIQVDDGSPPSALASAGYEKIAARAGRRADFGRSPDDLLLLYTGGTTGMPKGVMWRQGDLWRTLGGGSDLASTRPPVKSMEELRARVADGGGIKLLPASPLMHGTGLFTAMIALNTGGTVVTLDAQHFDPHSLWAAAERHRVQALAIVGDAFAKPLLAALEERRYDLSELKEIISSGVMWSPEVKAGLLRHLPQLKLIDTFGASEATGFGTTITTAGGVVQRAKFRIGKNVKVFTSEGEEVRPGSSQVGFIARCGPIPLGYYKDPEKTAATFRVIGGSRYAIPGDYCTVDADGTIHLLGRGSVCINTGGEKVYPEEVEETIKLHPAVRDAAVVGVPDERWGEAVTAIVEPEGDCRPAEAEIRAFVRSRLAGFKVPKHVLFVEKLGRSPSGKIDYKGLRALATERLRA